MDRLREIRLWDERNESSDMSDHRYRDKHPKHCPEQTRCELPPRDVTARSDEFASEHQRSEEDEERPSCRTFKSVSHADSPPFAFFSSRRMT